MNDQVLRIQSRQGGPFKSRDNLNVNNLLDFDIPDSDVWDLSRSWVSLYVESSTTETAPNAPDGIHNLMFNWTLLNGTKTNFSNYNVALVRNASMIASNAGRLEDLHEVGVLRQTFKDYTMNNSERQSYDYREMNQAPDRSRYKTSLLTELNKEGTIKSRYVNGQIQIPLSDVYSLGRLQEYHATKWGKTRLHFELRSDRIGVLESTTVFQDENLQRECDNAGTGNFTQITTKNVYKRLEDSPFWVGQNLLIDASPNPAPTSSFPDLTNVSAQITGINWLKTGNDKGKLVLTLSWTTIATPVIPTGSVYDNITVLYVFAASVNTVISQAELVLTRVRNPSPPPDVLSYRTFTTEQFSGTGQTNFQRMFQLEPEAVNVFLMFPNQDLVSSNNNLYQYRLRLDNEDLIDREVTIINGVAIDPLHYDRLSMTFLNSGMQLKNFTQKNLNNNDGSLEGQISSGTNLLLIGNPLPVTSREKNLQVNLYSNGTGLQDLYLYKQVQRTLQL